MTNYYGKKNHAIISLSAFPNFNKLPNVEKITQALSTVTKSMHKITNWPYPEGPLLSTSEKNCPDTHLLCWSFEPEMTLESNLSISTRRLELIVIALQASF
ncbi:hypothetical protein Dsin_011158 [Dipteronia sinensis]|uniref:Uncharacterized protein n=1 Tax=Dipteronia sinensis TaxID=43782 RepID=A0AAE0AUM1_9ROSI|nr:hypothetical protein Dsin_011158 [Dipteronia sinensis]